MTISETRKQHYKEIGLNTDYLRQYYINRAKALHKALEGFTSDTDTYAKGLKKVLNNYILSPKRELKDVISDYNKNNNKKVYNSFSINNTLFEIYYVENELIDFHLGLCKPQIPVMDYPKPLTDKELDVILNNPKATDEKKELVREAKKRKVKASAKSGIHLNRLFPIIDFETKNISFWFD